MLQAIEAIIEKDGTVNLLESLHIAHPMRAVITLLEPITKPVMPSEPVMPTGHVSRVLALLNSPAFQNAPAGNPTTMETVIQANRTAWED